MWSSVIWVELLWIWLFWGFVSLGVFDQWADKINEVMSWEISWIWFCNLNMFKGFYRSCVIPLHRGMVITNQTVVNPRPLRSTCWSVLQPYNPWLIVCVNGCRSWWLEGPHEADGGLKDSRLQNAEISASQFAPKWKLQMFMKMPFKRHSGSCSES